MSGDAQLAEEITQETFFKALKGIDKFKHICSVKTWLCQIGKNSYLSYLEKQKRFAGEDRTDTEAFDSDMAQAGEQSPEAVYLKKDKRGSHSYLYYNRMKSTPPKLRQEYLSPCQAENTGSNKREERRR